MHVKPPEKSAEDRLRELESVMDQEDEGTISKAASPDLKLEKMPAIPRYENARKELPMLIPFLPEPGYRSFAANVPGDTGFDPLNLCTDVETFVQYREAEVKHSRLSMIAALAWPAAEVYDQGLAEEGLAGALSDTGGKVLFGGLGDSFVEAFLALAILIGAGFELTAQTNRDMPGDLGFDPVGLADFKPSVLGGLLPEGRPWTYEAELQHGRLAMLAIAYDIYDEVVNDQPTVETTEFIFHKIDAKLISPDYWNVLPEVLEEAENFPTFTESLVAP
jgi:hypothetical protein